MNREIGRIESEFILDTLQQSEATLELHADVHRATCRLIRRQEKQLLVAPLDDRLPESVAERRVVLYFKQHGRLLMVKGQVIEVTKRTIAIQYGGHVYQGSSRGVERIIDPSGIGVSLLSGVRRVELQMLASGGYEPAERPASSLGFDFDAIQNLLSQFRAYSSQFADNAAVVLFRYKSPSNVIERIMARSGCVVMLPFYSEEIRTKYPSFGANILSGEEASEIAAEMGVTDPTEQFRKRLGGLQAQGIARELLCPVLFRKYAVGYLHLIRHADIPFPPEAVRHCMQFRRILIYGLRLKGYFQKLEKLEPQSSATHLIDISGSGLLFSYPALYHAFPLYSEIALQIHFERRTLPARGRIMRRYDLDAERITYGVNFIDIDTKDLELLYDRLYGTNYRGDIDQLGQALKAE